MEVKGMTIDDLCRMTGLAKSTIQRVRSSKEIRHCTLDTLALVADALDVGICELFHYE
ncbi:MAG: helix-turn-helix domain-containing protein [Syntrophobacteraceae bacterium]